MKEKVTPTPKYQTLTVAQNMAYGGQYKSISDM